MTLAVGLDCSAAAVRRPTGVAVAIRSLARALRELPRDDVGVELLYRLSRLRRRDTFLEGGRVFHDRFSLLLARRLDVIHGPDSRLPRLRGPALVATIHDLSVRKDPRFSVPKFRDTRARHWDDCARRADRIITYTDAVRREVARELSFPLERIDVVPLAPSPACGGGPGRGTQDYVLVLGELSTRKNTAGAIRAFEKSAASKRGTLVLAGPDGHGAEEVRATLAATKARVRATGWVPDEDLARLLAGARVLFFPSRSEGFGLPLLEAFRAGVPVVASNDPSLVEVAGGAALHADADDHDALAEALARACEDETLRAELRARGLARVQEFSWERTARAALASYRAAARTREATPCPG